MPVDKKNEETPSFVRTSDAYRNMYVDLGDNLGVLNFNNSAEYIEFLELENNHWNWINSFEINNTLKNNLKIISEQYDKLLIATPKIRPNSHYIPTSKGSFVRSESTKITDIGPWQDLMIDSFSHLRIPLSNSNVGQFIEILSKKSPNVAAAALATWMSRPGVDWTDFEQIKGAMLMIAFDANITNENIEIVERKLNILNDDFSSSLATSKSEIQKYIWDINNSKDVYIAGIKKSVNRKYRAWRRFRTSKTDEIKNLIHQADNAEKGFREQMKLKAPVKYWSDKAEKHQTNANKYKRVLIKYSVIAGILLIAFLYTIAATAINVATNDKPAAVYLILVTLGVVLTTIVFWAARIIMRLFLSEHHLAIDAEERSVMTETYLALTADGHASETDRTIILSSLFRPTADGIVKDDAAPDLSPASLISRLASK